MRHLNEMKTRARLAQWTSVSVIFHSSTHRRKREERSCENEKENRKPQRVDYKTEDGLVLIGLNANYWIPVNRLRLGTKLK